MVYPLDIFENTASGKPRGRVEILGYEIKTIDQKGLSWKDKKVPSAPTGDVIILPMPNGGLSDSFSNNYTAAPNLYTSLAQTALESNKNASILLKAGKRAGFVPDPKTVQLYEGSNTRSWNPSWTLIARNAGEAAAIAAILKTIKKLASPKASYGFDDKIGLLRQPNVIKIKFNNPFLQSMTKYDLMAISGYSIDYFAQGYPSTFKDLFPKQISLSLELTEYGIVTEDKWS